jgi:hypothetical protein
MNVTVKHGFCLVAKREAAICLPFGIKVAALTLGIKTECDVVLNNSAM